MSRRTLVEQLREYSICEFKFGPLALLSIRATVKTYVDLEGVERLRLGGYAFKPTDSPTCLKWLCLRKNKRRERKAGEWW